MIVAENARPPIDGGTVLITGASAGIGRELAVQLAPRARTLILLARRAGRLEELRTTLLAKHPQLQVLTLPVDLSDETDVGRAIAEAEEQAGAIDVLVNNAGVGDQALADQADWARVRNVLRTNVLAVAQLTTALVRPMVDRGRGGVLNMGSGAGLTVTPAAAAYSASKHFMDGFSEALRADLTGTGVVVTQVCPGPVDSEFDQLAGSAGGMTRRGDRHDHRHRAGRSQLHPCVQPGLGSITWGPEIAEVYDMAYAAKFEPSVLGPSSNCSPNWPGADRLWSSRPGQSEWRFR